MQLRDYQRDGKARIEKAWNEGHKNVLFTMATGGGKTVMFATIAGENSGPVAIVAHRQELVFQISLTLAKQGIYHRIIGPKNVVKIAVAQHMEYMDRVFYDSTAPVGVAGVDTLIRRGDRLKNWLDTVTLWVQDECHHIQKSNKWGRAVALMPNARGLGVTAEPSRSDGRGLGWDNDGVFHTIVEGPGLRQLIDDNWLTDYEIVCPGGDIDLTKVEISPQTGDYKKPQLTAAVRRSKIVGRVVLDYLRFAHGSLGITFATDVETAADIADEYNRAGVPAAAVSYKTSDTDREAALKRFRRRGILQLVNCDLFGEGFDLPAVEVVSMARPTESYGLYLQQFGRALRKMQGKQRALIIDHAGNVERHFLPDVERPRSLARRVKGRVKPLDAIPIRVCTDCVKPYRATLPACPYCGFVHVPADRSTPEFVDGDLELLDAEALEAIRQRVAAVDKDPEVYRTELAAKHAPVIGQLAHVKRHVKRQETQAKLRGHILEFCRVVGKPTQETQREFFHTFGIDVMSARALGTKDAEALGGRVWDWLLEYINPNRKVI